jgi:hypothetical protein
VTSVEINVDKFKEAFAKFQSTSKRSVATNLRQQGKLIAVDIAKRTPPGDFQATGWKRIAGETSIKADLAKIMKPTKTLGTKKRATRFDPQRIHKEYRRKRGRVQTDLRRGKDERFRIEAATFTIYRNRVLQRVGYMAAGWAKAAQFLGASMPGWITRHSAPGAGTVNVRGEDIELELTNAAVYPDSRGLVDRRAVAALKKRYWAMVKQADNYIKMAAQEAGFTTGVS